MAVQHGSEAAPSASAASCVKGVLFVSDLGAATGFAFPILGRGTSYSLRSTGRRRLLSAVTSKVSGRRLASLGFVNWGLGLLRPLRSAICIHIRPSQAEAGGKA